MISAGLYKCVAKFFLRPSAPSNNGFQQLNPFPNSSQTPSGVGTNNFPSGSVGKSFFSSIQ